MTDNTEAKNSEEHPVQYAEAGECNETGENAEAEAAAANTADSADAKKRRLMYRRRRLTRITVAVVSVCVIAFAFIWESALSKGSSEKPEVYPYRGRSAVQDELEKLDWVIPGFLPENEYSRPGTLLESVDTIVIHYIGNPNTTAEQNRSYFAGLAVSGETYASSNFIISLDGEIIQCVPVDEIAYASNTRNIDTLSIELCHPDDTGEFTPETYASAVRLTAWLCSSFNIDAQDLIRHYDVTGKICPKYFVENEGAWEAFKSDVAQAMTDEN